MWKRIITALFLANCALQAGELSERKIQNNAIISERDPKVRIELPVGVRYAGASRWILYEIADCELHVFVEADDQQNVKRLYWIQFEGYLPSKPDLHHRYDSPRHTDLGGMDFYVDTSIDSRDDKVTPGSDTEHLRGLIRAKGYKMPDGMISVRLVHLLDKAKRKELMIIYAEDVGSTGLTAADLKDGGKAQDQWPGIESELIERAKEKVKIEQ